MQRSENPIFHEVQLMRHVWWVMLLVLGIAFLMWWGFFQQIVLDQPWGSNPGPDWLIWLLWIIFGLLFPIGFYFMRLAVEVYDAHLSIKYIPFTNRILATSEIKNVESITYKPIRQYGGWGIRGWSSRRAYTISGDKGVELTLRDGRIILLGSQKPDELALAIHSQLLKK